MAQEIYSSESSYISVLDLTKEVCCFVLLLMESLNFLSKKVFMDPLRASLSHKPLLSQDKQGLIFGNLSFIRSINGELLAKLAARIKEWTPTQQLGDIFVEMVNCCVAKNKFSVIIFQADSLQYSYSQYINNYDQALKTLSWCQQHEPQFAQFLEVCPFIILFLNILQQAKEHPKYGHLEVGSCLIAPVQRLPRYNLLLLARFSLLSGLLMCSTATCKIHSSRQQRLRTTVHCSCKDQRSH